MNPTIRRATPADLDVLVRFNAASAYESEGITLDETVLREGVRAAFADPHKGFYTVAEVDGVVAGQVLVTYEWSDWRNGWFWWIQSVYVAKAARRKGVFRALLERVKEQAMADPAVIGLRLYVELHNYGARQAYVALGLEPEPYGLMGLYPFPGRTNAIRG